MRYLIATLLFCLASATAYAGGHCCSHCGACYPEKKCVPNEKTCFEVECKEICIPAVKFPWESCCKMKPGCYRKVYTLKKKDYECGKKVEWEWGSRPCPHCGHCDNGGCTVPAEVAPVPADDEVPQPPAVSTRYGVDLVPPVLVESR